jgi:hemolysin activation/secretion protein
MLHANRVLACKFRQDLTEDNRGIVMTHVSHLENHSHDEMIKKTGKNQSRNFRRLRARKTLFHLFVCPMILGIALMPLHLDAQQKASALQEEPIITVQEFVIDGFNPLPGGRSDKILSDYLARPLTIGQLREAATELEKELARDGHNFYRAILPPQKLVSGVVRLAIERIDIATVMVSGNEYFSSKNIARSLPLVSEGKSPNTQKIASALLLAEDNPAKDVRVVFVKGQEPQTVDANITVNDQNPNELFLWANNAGSDLASRSRLGIQYHNRNLWDRDHQFAVSYATSPEDTDELSQYGLNYRLPIFTTRGMANLFYSKSDADTGRVADVFDISGAGETVGFGYTQYLDKHSGYQHRLGFDVVDKLFDSDVLFETQNIGNDVRSRPITIEYTSRLDYSNWLINSIVSHSSNLSGGSLNNDQSYSAIRAGASSDWSKQNLSMRLDYRWNREWSGLFTAFAQASSDALIPGEKFGLGGSLGDPGPRGFLEREVTVDQGYKVSLEVARNFPTKQIKLGAFYDYASGDQNNPQVGEVAEQTLASVGVKLQWIVRTDLSLNVDYGYVLDGVSQEFSNGAKVGTDDGDDRWHISLQYFPAWPFGGEK